MERGGFRLAKFVSSSREVIATLPSSECSCDVIDLDLDKSLPSTRALGVLWDVEGDRFTFQFAAPQTTPTKRGVLSALSAI